MAGCHHVRPCARGDGCSSRRLSARARDTSFISRLNLLDRASMNLVTGASTPDPEDSGSVLSTGAVTARCRVTHTPVTRSQDVHRALLEAIGVDDETPVWRLREPLRWKGTVRDSAKTLA